MVYQLAFGMIRASCHEIPKAAWELNDSLIRSSPCHLEPEFCLWDESRMNSKPKRLNIVRECLLTFPLCSTQVGELDRHHILTTWPIMSLLWAWLYCLFSGGSKDLNSGRVKSSFSQGLPGVQPGHM